MIEKSEAYLIIERHYKRRATQGEYKRLHEIEENCKIHTWATSPSDKFRWCINCCAKERRGTWEPEKWFGSGWCGSVVPSYEDGDRLMWKVKK